LKIRTVEHLVDHLDEDLIWRKKELSVLLWLLAKATADRRGPLLRASVALVYAHWEGFIKTAGSSYLEFVSNKRFKYSELTPNFIAMGARGLFRRAEASSGIAFHLELTEFFLARSDEICRLPYKDGVKTGSNLSSVVLKEIVTSLGLDFAPFEMKAHLIDERLLKERNSIAHGEYLLVDEESVEELAREVLDMLEAFRNQIDNAAILGTYRSS
jgi:hypothetical protein